MVMGATRRRPGRRHGEAGAELVEMALTLPLILFVLLAICDFGFVFQKHEIITNSAREGARLAAKTTSTPATIQSRVLSYVQDSGLPTTAGNLSITVTPTTISAAGGTWNATTVDVFYTHQYVFLGPVATWFGGIFSSATLNGQATMRSEVGVSGLP